MPPVHSSEDLLGSPLKSDPLTSHDHSDYDDDTDDGFLDCLDSEVEQVCWYCTCVIIVDIKDTLLFSKLLTIGLIPWN